MEDKIANFDQQLKPSPTMESTSSETPSEPVQEVSDDVDESVSAGVLQQPEQNEAEVSQAGSKKKRRNFF